MFLFLYRAERSLFLFAFSREILRVQYLKRLSFKNRSPWFICDYYTRLATQNKPICCCKTSLDDVEMLSNLLKNAIDEYAGADSSEEGTTL